MLAVFGFGISDVNINHARNAGARRWLKNPAIEIGFLMKLYKVKHCKLFKQVYQLHHYCRYIELNKMRTIMNAFYSLLSANIQLYQSLPGTS